MMPRNSRSSAVAPRLRAAGSLRATAGLLALGALAAAAAIAMFLHRTPEPPASVPAATPAAPRPAAVAAPAPAPAAGRSLWSAPAPSSPAPEDMTREAIENSGAPFRADASGRLVLDSKTRERVEALIALTEPDRLYAAVAEAVRGLPSEAAAQARELVERYQLYLEEQLKLVPAGQAPADEKEALAQLEAMEKLRIAHFGAAAARALFGEEAALARELLELARLETDPILTLEQRIERAQSRYLELNKTRQAEAQASRR